MRAKLKWAAALAMALVLVAAFTPWRIWSQPLRKEFATQARRTTGLEAAVYGPISFALLPRPHVDYADVALGASQGAVGLRARRLRGELRLAPLLFGRVEFANVRLYQPEIVIDPSGFRSDAATVLTRASAAPTATKEARKADLAKLGAVTIIGGRARIRAHGADAVALDDIDAVVDWQSLGEAASLAGQLTWRGEQAQVEALVGKPAELLRGERSPFTLKIASRSLDVTLDGAIAGGARWLVDARLASTSERLRNLLALLNVRPALPGKMARFAVSGQLRALPQTMSLSDLKLTLDSNSFDGSLALRLGEARPVLSGTLASRSLEFAPHEVGVPHLRGHDRKWNRETLATPRFDLFDADMRLSAAKAQLGRVSLADAGVMMTISEGRLELTVAGAEMYGGKVKGRLMITPNERGLNLRSSGGFANVDAGAFLRDVARVPRLYGATSGEFSLDTTGATVAAMMQQLNGRARLSVRKGEIMGIDVEQAVRRADKRPLSIPMGVRTGQTNFLTAEVAATVARGLMKLDEAHVSGSGVEMAIKGEVDIGRRLVRLDIAASPPAPATPPATPPATAAATAATEAAIPAPEPPLLNLDLVGSWDNPVMTIDTESLIRRSEAAAPLWRRSLPEDQSGSP